MNKKYLFIIALCAVFVFGAVSNGAVTPAATARAAQALTPPPILEENKAAPASHPVFLELDIEGIIDVAIADYLEKGIALAEKENDAGVLIVMQTPGGLDISMRKICDRIFASKVPVITYIYPRGSRAASAGVFILISSHVAAMAEGTNIGTAHPVDYQGHSASEKITNDAVATIRDWARLRGRNQQWAADAVLKNVSISEIEAFKLKVIDIIAKDPENLMKQLDKMKVKVNDREVTLNTAGYELRKVEPSARYKFLHLLSDPNIVYVLFIIGIYGLIYELANGGTVLFPGIAGAIAIMLAFLGFGSLPIDHTGVILIAIAAVLFFLDIINPTHGALTVGGIISLTIGSLLLFPNRAMGEEWAVNYMLIAAVVIITVVFFVIIVAAVVKAMKKKTISGVQSILGLKGMAVTAINRLGGVANIGGEEWQAAADEEIAARDIVEVLEVNGMKIKVKKIPRNKEG
jgi:membrane-bound serine protease (ClpP class)